jgi:hypothetical protein
MVLLGVTVGTRKLTLEVTPERFMEISLLVEAWLRKKKASLRDLQSLLGKLHFIATCVRPGRILVSRLLNWLRKAFPPNIVGSGHKIYRKIPHEVQQDLSQASTNNDISITLSGVPSNVNFLVSTITPGNSILVVGATLFSGDSSNPQFSNN